LEVRHKTREETTESRLLSERSKKDGGFSYEFSEKEKWDPTSKERGGMEVEKSKTNFDLRRTVLAPAVERESPNDASLRP